MAEVTPPEPQLATDYDDRMTAAVKSVLIEIGQVLARFRGKFVVVGGALVAAEQRGDAACRVGGR